MKNAIVTGASNGIGLEISKKLSENNYYVGMIDVDKDNLFKESENIRNSVAIEGDVTSEDSIKNALNIFNKTPDLIVNNAGIVIFGGLEEQSIEDFKKSVDVSLIGSYIVSRLAIASMIKKNSGCIINMSSINGVHPGPGTGGYPPAKSGIISLTQQMSIEWGPYGIRTNSIAPGFIDAGMSKPIYAVNKVRELRGNAVPIKKLGEADDIANAVLFLASDNASYINGHNLVVDGGVINSVLGQLPRD